VRTLPKRRYVDLQSKSDNINAKEKVKKAGIMSAGANDRVASGNWPQDHDDNLGTATIAH
jgi:hypothetical protein